MDNSIIGNLVKKEEKIEYQYVFKNYQAKFSDHFIRMKINFLRKYKFFNISKATKVVAQE